MSAYAQSDVKLEAESAAYANCKLIDDAKYSSGQALELTDAKAKITFTYNAAEGHLRRRLPCHEPCGEGSLCPGSVSRPRP